MNEMELRKIIHSGEDSGVEFKRDDVHSDSLAKEMVALLNLEGGLVLLGVEDDGRISGLTRSREDAERWVMDVARQHVQPALIPAWRTVTLEDGKAVGVIVVPADSPGKPHKAKRGSAWMAFVRVGSTSREATREEEARLYQTSHLMRYDIKPVLEMGFESLDLNRLENYFRDILKRDAPDRKDADAWQRLLLNTDILAEAAGTIVATVAGLLLFGVNPNRRLPQAGVTATAFPRKEKDYDTVDEELVRGPLVSVLSKRGRAVEKGVIDRTVDFVARNLGTTAWLEGGRRRRKKSLPLDAVREAVVNAAAHRDYTIVGTDIEVSLYRDRLEVISPGRLPNGVTVEKMKDGLRAARNELLKEILRDYGYVEHLGMGVRNRIIQSMRAHNGTEPDLVEDGERFIVRLWKERKPG
ncbi:MAG: ATP-binding protein [Gammaproteobacteria bacterium]